MENFTPVYLDETDGKWYAVGKDGKRVEAPPGWVIRPMRRDMPLMPYRPRSPEPTVAQPSLF